LGNVLSDKTREAILSQITPSPQEIQHQSRVIRRLTEALEKRAKEIGQKYSFIGPQGSTGKKQTQLRGAADIDLFVALPLEGDAFVEERESDRKQALLDSMMNRMVDEWFIPAASAVEGKRIQRTYSQHPYLSLELDGLEVDILACFDLSSDYIMTNGPITAVDRTVHHTNYVADRLTPELQNTVRLLKSFVRASHAYGDKCAVGQMGITGVALEILAIQENSFDDALERLYRLDVDPLDHLGRTKKKLRRKPAFRDDYIILIDPTDPERNIASSFTERAYRWVKHRIDQLRESSSDGDKEAVMGLMLEAPIPSNPLPNGVSSHYVSAEFAAVEEKHYTILRDKLYSFARKTQARLETERTGEPRFGKVLIEVYFEADRYAIGYLVERPELEEYFIRRGPPSTLEKASQRFFDAHPDAFEENGYLYVKEKRNWVLASEMVKHLAREGQVKGLEFIDEHSEVSMRVLNVLHRFVREIEATFGEEMTTVKD
jgi:tRNA CCA-adding enzyme